MHFHSFLLCRMSSHSRNVDSNHTLDCNSNDLLVPRHKITKYISLTSHTSGLSIPWTIITSRIWVSVAVNHAHTSTEAALLVFARTPVGLTVPYASCEISASKEFLF